jgi:hypothetical protein
MTCLALFEINKLGILTSTFYYAPMLINILENMMQYAMLLVPLLYKFCIPHG